MATNSRKKQKTRNVITVETNLLLERFEEDESVPDWVPGFAPFEIDEGDNKIAEKLYDSQFELPNQGHDYAEHELVGVPEIVRVRNDPNRRVIRVDTPIMMVNLPKSIVGLDALEILDLSRSVYLRRLPAWISKLKNLKEIHIPNSQYSKAKMDIPASFQKLTNLRIVEPSF